MPLSRPMIPEVDCAQMRLNIETRPGTPASNRHRGLDPRMRVIVDDRDVVERVVEYRITRCENEFRVRPGIAAQLQRHLLDVVVVDVAVPSGPDELADVEAGL